MTRHNEAEALRNSKSLLLDLKNHKGWGLYNQILGQAYTEKVKEMQSNQLTPDERQYAAGQADGMEWTFQVIDTAIDTYQNQIDVLETKEADQAEQSNEAIES